MKKEYKAPKIVVEDFSLIENIAINTCSQTTNHTKDDCSYNASGDIPEDMKEIFEDMGIDPTNVFYSPGACKSIVGGDIEIDCLNGFMNVFSS